MNTNKWGKSITTEALSPTPCLATKGETTASPLSCDNIARPSEPPDAVVGVPKSRAREIARVVDGNESKAGQLYDLCFVLPEGAFVGEKDGGFVVG